jgi:EAL domain-containing protein (putative c-di-GMP-specific phosphodiesterase class I)
VYQPLVALADGRLCGVEALLRWHHPHLGLLTPDRFIGLAEESGFIARLGRWVLTEACRQAAAWRATSDLFVSVNVAPAQTHEPSLVDDVRAALKDTGLPAAALQLELTESALMDTTGAPLDALRALAEHGVRLAIDDFGTGYSNLAYLRSLPVHVLKLAGPFMRGLRTAQPDDPADEQIVDTLIRLAHLLGLTVTAEGVETPEQADRLRAYGCDAAQGWHFALPEPPEALTARLRAGRSLD